MTATDCGGIPSWKQRRPGMVRRVGSAAIGAIGAIGIVKAVTGVRMACRCPVNDVAGGDARLSDE